VYLDTCQTSGATTFPLATRLDSHDRRETLTEAHHAASHLVLTENTLHTRMLKQLEAVELGHKIEEAALEQYINDNKDDNHASPWSRKGIRVVPEAGHCCIFSSLMENGSTNPFSIHGGEALLNEDVAKDAVTFFYEIPISTFSSREELGKEVSKREAAFLKLNNFCAEQMRDSEDRTQEKKRNF
jgi:hypothetical protein